MPVWPLSSSTSISHATFSRVVCSRGQKNKPVPPVADSISGSAKSGDRNVRNVTRLVGIERPTEESELRKFLRGSWQIMNRRFSRYAPGGPGVGLSSAEPVLYAANFLWVSSI